jgi:hypothetical protein
MSTVVDSYPAADAVRRVLESMFRLRAENTERYGFIRSQMGKLTFIKEHRTVKLALPRQCGNSTAAAHAANMLGICDKDSGSGLVLVPSERQVSILRSYGAQRVVSLPSIHNKAVSMSIASLVVDDASRMSEETLDLAMSWVDDSKGGWVVLIG